MKSNAEIVAHISRTIDDAAPPPEMIERMQNALKVSDDEHKTFQMNLLALCAMHGEETMRKYGIDRDSMMRNIANTLLHTGAFVVRSTKRQNGDELNAARFALVAYTIADQALESEWDTSGERVALENLAPADGSIRQAIHEDRLHAVQLRIRRLGSDDAIRVECISRSLRNLLEAAGEHAKLALDLVIEERGVAGLLE